MTRFAPLFIVAALVGCAPGWVDPGASAPPPRVAHDSVAPQVIAEARRAQAAVDRAATEPDLSNADLIRTLDLTRRMRGAVRIMRAHRTASHISAARSAIRDLREFMRR